MNSQRDDDPAPSVPAEQSVLIDYLLGRCDEATAGEVRARVSSDASFRRMHEDVSNVLAALSLAPEYEPPDDLVRKTVARLRSAQRTEALLAREEMSRVYRPTFSIRELGVAAAAVVVLAAVFVPLSRQARFRAAEGQCASQAGQIGSALQAYATANDGNLPVASGQVQRWLATENEPAASNSAVLFRLIRQGYASPVVFQCPAVGGGSFAVQAGMSDFPANRFINYSYHYALGPNALSVRNPALSAVAMRMAILADSTPLFDQSRFRRERLNAAASENHRMTGQNVLYLDMHVEWAKVPTVGVSNDNIFLVEGKYDYFGDEKPAQVTDTFLLPAYSGVGLNQR